MSEATTGPTAVLVILGPTATGKTAIAVEVAERVRGEIISADSRAFFQGLDVVTDKPRGAERARVPHHLIDLVPIDGQYDAMAFRQDVARLVPEIAVRGAVPMLVGGGTLYLGAVLRGLFDGAGRDDRLRAELADMPTPVLHARLAAVDPPAAATIHRADRLRIVRALEVHTQTGHRISELQSRARPLPFAFFSVGLLRQRDDHREAIERRAHRMIENGLLAEVDRARSRGLREALQAYRTIGIPEATECLDGRLSREQMEQEIAHRTWRLARRQRAWFRRDKDLRWIDVTGRSSAQVAEDIVAQWHVWRETE